MSEGTPSTSSSVEDENEKNCAVTPRITGAFTPAWPKGWNTRPGVLRSSSCRRVLVHRDGDIGQRGRGVFGGLGQGVKGGQDTQREGKAVSRHLRLFRAVRGWLAVWF